MTEPLHELVAAVAKMAMPSRRRVEPASARHFSATMRNDFLTPRGTPYKWQEVTAAVTRTLIGGGVPTVIPVRYTWDRVDARTGNPDGEGDPREWTFARGQSFTSLLMHTDVAGADTASMSLNGVPLAPMDVS